MEEVGSWSFPRAAPLELGLFRRFHATCSYKRTIYVFGGETKITTNSKKGPPVKRMLNDLLAFTPEDNSWQVLDDGTDEAPSRRKGVQLVVCKRNDSLYLFGGAGPGIYYNDLWRFDLVENRWHNESTKCLENCFSDEIAYPAPRAYHITEIFDDQRLLVYGGYGVELDHEALWEYDLQLCSWRSLHSPHGPGMRFGLCACVYNGGLYIVTGQQNNRLVPQTLWRLDLATGKYVWQQLATSGSPPTQRTYAASMLIELRTSPTVQGGGRWLLHGGSSADTVFNDAYELDLDTLHWHPSLTLSTEPTIEGHTMTGVKTTWGSTSVFMLGGASSGPVFPKGPIARCDLFLSRWCLSPENMHLKLEDFSIRIPYVADYLWELHRSHLRLEDRVNILSSDKSELEEENRRLGEILKYHQKSYADRNATMPIRTALENALLTLDSIQGTAQSTTNSMIENRRQFWDRMPHEIEDHLMLSYITNLAKDLTTQVNAVHDYCRELSENRSEVGRKLSHSVALRNQQQSSRHSGRSTPPISPRVDAYDSDEIERKKMKPVIQENRRVSNIAITRAVVCGKGDLRLYSLKESADQ